MVPAQSKIICNSLDSTLRTALASLCVSDTDWYSIGGILSVKAILRQVANTSVAGLLFAACSDGGFFSRES